LSINPIATTGIKTCFAQTDKRLSVPKQLFLFVQVLPFGIAGAPAGAGNAGRGLPSWGGAPPRR
jgi:hypothetical protein